MTTKVRCKKGTCKDFCDVLPGGTYLPTDEYVLLHKMPAYMLKIVPHATHTRFHAGLVKFWKERGFLSAKQIMVGASCLSCQSGSREPSSRNDIGEAMGGKYDQGGYDDGSYGSPYGFEGY